VKNQTSAFSTNTFKKSHLSFAVAFVGVVVPWLIFSWWYLSHNYPGTIGLGVAAIISLASLLAAALIWTRELDRARQSVRQTLSESEALVDALFAKNPQPIVMLDPEGRFIRINAAARQLGGYPVEEMMGKRFEVVVCENQRKKAVVFARQAFKGKEQSFETAIQHKEGYRIDIQVSLVPVRTDKSDKVEALLAIFQDISETKRSIERIRYMAYYDDMTGIPNRKYFRDHLENALLLADYNRSRIAVLFIDIDRFKIYNDSFGHDAGNVLLLQAAERLTHCVSSHDVLARMEGDEFAIFYTDISGREEAEERIEQIRAAFQPPFECQGYTISMTVSVGAAINEKSGIDADTLMKQADIALTRAKEMGRDTFEFYTESMEQGALDRLTLESDLRVALQRNEFELHYQPQVNILTGQVVGVECLIRWNHPERGIIMPRDFIGLAEENGMIVPIGEFVVAEACRQAIRWKQEGLPPFPVSVNLSLRQFLQPNLAGRISQILQETGMEPERLELEITESATSDVQYAERVLQGLKKLGVQICIDDFGTGYSSLNYLRRFPISRLKIDRSFVRDVMTDQQDAQIVQTIIAMARHMNLKVIAEGVENEEQQRFLERHQCLEAQGYLYAKPMPAAEFAEWMATRKA
jgi:diguanylate cyclase (GGDEF)-like protein/PAS domain S-box-containing protein